MKYKIAVLFLAFSTFCFAEDFPSYSKDLVVLDASSKLVDPQKGRIYVRFTTSDTDVARQNMITPGLGVGYRRSVGNGALDLSISGNGSERFKKAFWSFPKATYLQYFTPEKERSFYAGAGIAWGGVYLDRSREFIGLIPSVTLGYEPLHKFAALGFTELTISQPAVALHQKGKISGPVVEMAVGAGF